MADSFGTIPFTVLAAGVRRGVTAEIAVTHIPGGTVTYYDYAGQMPPDLNYRLLLSAADYALMEGTAGGTAQLVSAVDGTISSAALMSISRTQRLPGGTTYADARFVVVVP